MRTDWVDNDQLERVGHEVSAHRRNTLLCTDSSVRAEQNSEIHGVVFVAYFIQMVRPFEVFSPCKGMLFLKQHCMRYKLRYKYK